MPLTSEQTEQTCGFLLLNEFNVFIYCCKSCPYEFESGSKLEAHILLQHQVQDAKTGIESVFVLDGVLQSKEPCIDDDQTLMTVDEIKQEIEIEPTVFQDPLLNQRVSNNGEISYQRTLTNEDQSKPMQLELRLDSRKYYCEMCPFNEVNFTRKVDIQQHLRQHFVSKVLKACPICNETTPNFSIHMKTHHNGIKPYKCTMCERRFPSESLRMNHIRTHTGERPFLCQTCGKSFKTTSSLKSHTDRLHKSGKMHPYLCATCDLSFLLKYQYEQHRLSAHGDERPHVCDICGVRFKATKTLRNHKFTHGERTNKCKFCGKQFKTNDYKRQHELKVHGDEYSWRR